MRTRCRQPSGRRITRGPPGRGIRVGHAENYDRLRVPVECQKRASNPIFLCFRHTFAYISICCGLSPICGYIAMRANSHISKQIPKNTACNSVTDMAQSACVRVWSEFGAKLDDQPNIPVHSRNAAQHVSRAYRRQRSYQAACRISPLLRCIAGTESVRDFHRRTHS